MCGISTCYQLADQLRSGLKPGKSRGMDLWPEACDGCTRCSASFVLTMLSQLGSEEYPPCVFLPTFDFTDLIISEQWKRYLRPFSNWAPWWLMGLGNKAAWADNTRTKKYLLNNWICSCWSKKPFVVLKRRHDRTKKDWSITADVLLFSPRTKIEIWLTVNRIHKH